MTDRSKQQGSALPGFDGSDAALDALLAEVSSVVPAPSASLMARVLADAEHAMPKVTIASAAPQTVAHNSGSSGWLGRVFGVLGGWGGIGGLVSATVAGVWIGFGDIGGGLGVATILGAGGTETATTVELMPDAAVFAQTGTGG